MRVLRPLSVSTLVAALFVFAACGSEDGAGPGADGDGGAKSGGAGGSTSGAGGAKAGGAGSAGKGGLAGTSGAAGGSAAGGASGNGGGTSTAGTGGAGASNAGSGGAGASNAGTGGSAGQAGTAGVAGTGGSAAGKAGSAGGAGASGSAGSPGKGGAAGGPVEEEEVVIAAAGDISNTSIGGQKITADLILAGKYDAVLTMGDNQYNDGTLSAYNQYYDKTWGQFFDKTYPVPGNHEYNTSGAKGYFDYFGARAHDPKKGYYSFDLGAWHLIAINSNSECGAIACDAGSAQEKWLRADLAAHKQKCTLAYWHHPRWSSGEHGNSTEMGDLWKALYEFDADLVLNGHDHNYERFAPQNPKAEADDKRGIVEFVVGTGGTGFRDTPNKPKNSVKKNHDTFGVLELVLKADGYDFEFIGKAGSTFTDKGSGKCH